MPSKNPSSPDSAVTAPDTRNVPEPGSVGAPGSSAAKVRREISKAAREGRRLREIVQDLPEKEALDLYEVAGLRPGGSNVRAFLEAKRQRFLSLLENDERLHIVLGVWKDSQIGFPATEGLAPATTELLGEGELEPLACARRLAGWRQALLIWLVSADVVQDLPPILTRELRRSVEHEDQLAGPAIDRWRTWYRVARVSDEAFSVWMRLSDPAIDTVRSSLNALFDALATDRTALAELLDSGELADLPQHASARASGLMRLCVSARGMARRLLI